ncbi:MAG TPA: zinc ribbon domain-containing protein, partial [Mycobacteriales bacterium]|nr:zinc ribbon domain-containing protein [Mycobacteriales bacterium]
MRPCPQCGAQAQGDDDFCGNCGTYLGWGRDGGPGSPAPAERPAGTVERSSELGGTSALDD